MLHTSKSPNLAQQYHRTKIRHFFIRRQKILFSDFGSRLKMPRKIMAVFGLFPDLIKDLKIFQTNIIPTLRTCPGHQMAELNFGQEEKMNILKRKISIGFHIKLKRAIWFWFMVKYFTRFDFPSEITALGSGFCLLSFSQEFRFENRN